MRLITNIKLECALFEVRRASLEISWNRNSLFDSRVSFEDTMSIKVHLYFVNATFPLFEYRHAMC